jgi:hypothetical protein
MHSSQPPDVLREEGGSSILAVKLQPRASRSEILGVQADELRVRVTAPPVDSAANEALTALLAEALGVGRRQVELVRGQTSRHKQVRIRGLTPDEIRTRLNLGE